MEKKRKGNIGTLHKAPADWMRVLSSDLEVGQVWEDLTPLARNEWICWMVSVKKPETRRRHMERAEAELKKGKRRPCCFAGCPHRF